MRQRLPALVCYTCSTPRDSPTAPKGLRVGGSGRSRIQCLPQHSCGIEDHVGDKCGGSRGCILCQTAYVLGCRGLRWWGDGRYGGGDEALGHPGVSYGIPNVFNVLCRRGSLPRPAMVPPEIRSITFETDGFAAHAIILPRTLLSPPVFLGKSNGQLPHLPTRLFLGPIR